MDSKNRMSVAGEIRAMGEFAKDGFHVFNQVSGKAPFDFVAYRDGRVYRVSVKSTCSTRRKAFVVQLQQTRVNTKGAVARAFDASESDVLCVYIEPMDTVLFFRACDFDGMKSLSIREKRWSSVKGKQHVMGEHLDIEAAL